MPEDGSSIEPEAVNENVEASKKSEDIKTVEEPSYYISGIIIFALSFFVLSGYITNNAGHVTSFGGIIFLAFIMSASITTIAIYALYNVNNPSAENNGSSSIRGQNYDSSRNESGSKLSELSSLKQVKVKVPMAKMTQVAIGLVISGSALIVIGLIIDSINVTDYERFQQLQTLSFNVCCGGFLVLLITPIPLMIGQQNTKLRKQRVIIKHLEEKGDESGELKKYMSTIKINKENDVIRNWSLLGIALGFISFVMAVVYFFDYGEDACVGFCGLGTLILILSGVNLFRIEKKSGTDWALIVIVILVALQIVPLLFMSLTESW